MPTGTRHRAKPAAPILSFSRPRDLAFSCVHEVARAFRKYPRSRYSLSSAKSNSSRRTQMRVQLLSEVSHAKQLVLRMIAIAFLLASLMIGTAWPMSASGQVPPAVLPVAGMGATSPLAHAIHPAGRHSARRNRDRHARRQSGRPFANVGMTACDGSGGGSSSTFLFDGGGLSGNASLSCADSRCCRLPCRRRPQPGVSEFLWVQPNSAVPASVVSRTGTGAECAKPTTNPAGKP